MVVSASLIIAILVFLYFYREPPSFEKRCTALIFLGILTFIFFAALLYLPGNVFQAYYFFPIMGPFVIVIAEVMHKVIVQPLAQNKVKLAPIFVPLLFLYMLNPALFSRISTSIVNSYKNLEQHAASPSLSSFSALPYFPDEYVTAVANEITTIKAHEQKENFYFFQFRYYDDGQEKYPVGSDEILWVPLEEMLSVKLTRVSNAAYRDYVPMGGVEYIFLRCKYQPEEEAQRCVTPFLDDHPDYALVKKIHSKTPYSIYEMKQTLPY